MATIAEQLTSLANTKNAIRQAIVNKGVAVADDTPFSGYATKIGEIQGGGGAATMFGLGFDELVGVLNENGTLQKTTEPFEFNAVGLKDANTEYGFYFKFFNSSVVSVRAPDLTVISGYYFFSQAFKQSLKLADIDLYNLAVISGADGCFHAFDGCTGITKSGLKKLETVSGSNACQYMYHQCTKLIESGVENLTTVSGYNACSDMFSKCVNLPKAGLENLASVTGTWGCTYMFDGCTSLTKEYFPMLTVVSHQDGLGGSTSGMFRNCTNLTELHFRADAQAVIEGLSGYSAKFGATNATIYFDLIGTITVGGVAYARDEKQSIRVDGTKTFVGWKDANDNVVYTSYENNAEPAVGTTVYSDAGTTQVGTVEGVV